MYWGGKLICFGWKYVHLVSAGFVRGRATFHHVAVICIPCSGLLPLILRAGAQIPRRHEDNRAESFTRYVFSPRCSSSACVTFLLSCAPHCHHPPLPPYFSTSSPLQRGDHQGLTLMPSYPPATVSLQISAGTLQRERGRQAERNRLLPLKKTSSPHHPPHCCCHPSESLAEGYRKRAMQRKGQREREGVVITGG